MTWEIVAGLITLIGALTGIAKIISNNTKAMTEIRCTVETLHTSFHEQREDIGHIRGDMQKLKERVHDLECLQENMHKKQ